MTYAAVSDPACYPGTTVLRNRLGIQDQAKLDEVETAYFLTRAAEPMPAGDLDLDHYLAIHRHLFQDVYDWAGEIRTIRIGKGGTWFCYPEYIVREMKKIFGALAYENHLVGLSARDFATRAAHHFSDLNAVHPFREGNGRTQLSLLVMLAGHCGLNCNADILDPHRVLSAMIDSFRGDENRLAELIEEFIS